MTAVEKANMKDDAQKGEYMRTGLRVLYEACLATSEAIFIIANLFSLQSLATDYLLKNLLQFLSTPESVILTIIIIALFVIGYNLNVCLKKQDRFVLASTKKKIDFAMDIIRIIGYSLTAWLLGPFIFEQNNTQLFISFILMLLSILLCLVRKWIKWHTFGCEKQQKYNYEPWSIQSTTKTKNQQTQTNLSDGKQYRDQLEIDESQSMTRPILNN